ncbi:MAG TPA: YicC/YloC family endoribonuclease [Steroidobacteraceae bacterium]|nr:YicC/YloC family endoribonuclease [Steroidobacteraceae bacterium]
MIRSMTGFARRERAGDYGTLIWEVRTVNHRYLEASVRLPEELRSAEGEFRQAIAAAVRRGKVDATLQLRAGADARATLELDEALLEELIARSHEVARRATSKGGTLVSPTALDLMRWPGVLKDRERDASPLLAAAHATLAETLAALTATRASEGERIAAMLGARCQQIEALVAAVRARLPEVHARIRARLEERLAQLTLPAEPNRERLEQELALIVARSDVDEELDRLESHVAEVGQALAGQEPAGRRLDFLMQEFNREANTLSSKSQDTETTRAAVDMKVLIEQMREQVQNVE